MMVAFRNLRNARFGFCMCKWYYAAFNHLNLLLSSENLVTGLPTYTVVVVPTGANNHGAFSSFSFKALSRLLHWKQGPMIDSLIAGIYLSSSAKQQASLWQMTRISSDITPSCNESASTSAHQGSSRTSMQVGLPKRFCVTALHLLLAIRLTLITVYVYNAI